MTDYFPLALAFNWRPENDGQGCHVTPGDAGGATSWGVTLATWRAWQVKHGDNRPVDLAAFRALPRAAFIPLYFAEYWKACSCGSLGAIGVQVFDAAVNTGPGNAVRFLQHVLGVPADGSIGPITLRVALDTDQPALCRALCAEREAFYSTRATAPEFLRGWDRRAEACRDYVLSMLAIRRLSVSAATAPRTWR